MTLEEAKKVAEDNNITKERIKKFYGDFYRFEVAMAIDTPEFIEKVEELVRYTMKREALSNEYFEWRNKNKLGPLRVEFDLNSYLVAGIIPLKDMEEGYYLGRCRNNIVAYWDPKSKMFIHTRDSFNLTYTEKIPHLEEPDYTYDLFIPIRKMNISEVSENCLIDKWDKGVHVDHRDIIDKL